MAKMTSEKKYKLKVRGLGDGEIISSTYAFELSFVSHYHMPYSAWAALVSLCPV